MTRTALAIAAALALTTACSGNKSEWPSDSDVADDVTPTDEVEETDTDVDDPSDDADDPSDDADDPTETDDDVMDDEITDSEWDDPWTESETEPWDTGELLLLSVFGHAGYIDMAEMSGSGLVFEGVEWYGYYNPYYYGGYVCAYDIPAWGRASQYDCDQCDWAADISFGGEVSIFTDEDDLCSRMLGVEDGDTATAYDGSDWFTRPLGFSSDFTRADNGNNYADVTVYYFSSYRSWYPLQYSDYSGGYWSWYYVFTTYYYY